MRNKTYKRKQPPTVTIIEIVEDGIDKDDDVIVGYVSYLNEYGSKGVMPYKLFMEMYQESDCDD